MTTWLPEIAAAFIIVVGGFAVAKWATRHTQHLVDESARLRLRRDVLRQLADNRGVVSTLGGGSPDRFWEALNEVVVVFADAGAVMEALETFRMALHARSESGDSLPRLIQAMASECGWEALEPSRYKHVFTPSGK